ncbi:peptidoglycan-binding protein [Desulfotomaculum copahuensis]|uniref:peptidoglycan-binding protein n=1 Tax=Desulfotomaculum copahuensis TaxID=1838280 RepID=UPI0013732115|nr:peptidoglycan-binding protein [Desulfotomaculum copahuensis]
MFKILLTAATVFFCCSLPPLPAAAGPAGHRCDPVEPHVFTAPFHQGGDVASLQRCLAYLGYFHGAASGYYDRATMAALGNFQRQHHLSPSGLMDAPTWQVISRAMLIRAQAEEKIPSPHHDLCLLIDTFNLTLTVFSRGEIIRQYPVAVGRPGEETPVGSWRVANKSDEHLPGMGPRWMGLNIPGGSYGIHGTDRPWSIGTYASAGCVRMHNAHVLELFPWVTEGTPVLILGNPFGRFGEPYPVLQPGSCGAAVQEVQRVLKRLGYYQKSPDGVFGPGTADAVNLLRIQNGLPAGRVVDGPVYRLLGI